jgi:hypothetical protein
MEKEGSMVKECIRGISAAAGTMILRKEKAVLITRMMMRAKRMKSGKLYCLFQGSSVLPHRKNSAPRRNTSGTLELLCFAKRRTWSAKKMSKKDPWAVFTTENCLFEIGACQGWSKAYLTSGEGG